ncbi:efflux RND transporter periplasmic adaptor subunit [Cronobacter dublinensis]|uniref:efflux RND transporter periplasmic adaptor subunit n=1 Tax=Cronobacter dublinensis TaxID=413497 RepID=UPI000CFF2723|nr:efflux RND transporter periplasmic adaptor subunit [Cronobacter dublinensis]
MKLKVITASMLAASLMLSGCDTSQEETSAPAPKMKVVTKEVTAEDIFIEKVFPARVTAIRSAQIRPQVGGIIKNRMFLQGSEVRAGQALFQIDAAPFKADVEMAAAALAKANATALQMSQRARRLALLQKNGAVSAQDYDDARANSAQAAADVAEAQASLNRKKLDLEYATVRAPIDGRIDQEFVTEGALVGSGDSQAMATIQQIDHVYIDARVPAHELRALYAQNDKDNAMHISVQDENNKPYAVTPFLLFSGISVNDETGDVVLRTQAPNPQRILLPGMFVKLKVSQRIARNGIIVPEQAITRSNNEAMVWIVNASGKAQRVKVQTDGQNLKGIAVKAGLKTGDRLIIEGQDKVKDGQSVVSVNTESQV